MIEVATGMVFLMSSLYGAGHANAQTATVIANDMTSEQATTSVQTIGSLTDSKTIEAMVRAEYSDVPILIEVARCESTFRQYDSKGRSIRGIVNPQDVGVMQINEKYHAETAKKLGMDLYTVEGNLAFGRYLYNKYGTDPWVYSSKCWSAGNIAKK